MDVFDVKDTHGGYILCGRYGTYDAHEDLTGTPYGAFMLLTDKNGNVKKFMIYPLIYVLYSVVDFGKGSITKKHGFFAVGRTRDEIAQGGFKAVMLRTKYDLNPICEENVAGASATPDITESTFRWVVRRGSNNFAMVGHTNSGGENCMKDSDVLFAVADKKCNIKMVNNNLMLRQFKMKNADGNMSNEYGLSIADMGNNFIITGHVEGIDANCNAMDDDILLMKLNKKGLVAKAFRVDVDNGSDIGTSILYRTKKRSILVAGETVTSFLTAEQDPTLKMKKDIFLLEVDKKMKKAKKLEVFGDTWEENREVDVVLSQDNNAVILGNTRSFWPLVQPPLTPQIQQTYLIERYNKVNQRCYDAEVKVKLVRIQFKHLEPIHEKKETAYEERELEAYDVKLNQTIICKKET